MAQTLVSEEELNAFHASHFATIALDHFSQHFLGPVEEDYTEEVDPDDDGLGYYDDGVKRTLTDEQIAIFRHSEIQKLLRDRQNNATATIPNTAIVDGASNGSLSDQIKDEELDEGEVEDSPIPPPTVVKQPKGKKARKTKEKSFYKQNVKPDLRKRTWDKVEKSVGSLDYDEENSSAAPAISRASQRRKISYDDD